MKYIALALTLIFSTPSYAINVFSCTAGKSNKFISIIENDGILTYSYGREKSQPELLLRQEAKDTERFAWDGMGRSQSYSLTFVKGAYRYTVFTSVDTTDQTNSSGVYVEKGTTFVTQIDCKEGSITGDLEGYVERLGNNHDNANNVTINNSSEDYPVDALEITTQTVDLGSPFGVWTMITLSSVIDQITITNVETNNRRCQAHSIDEIRGFTRKTYPVTVRMGESLKVVMPKCPRASVVNMDVDTDRNTTLHYGK